MPSHEPTDEEIAALTRETNEEEALEWRKHRQATLPKKVRLDLERAEMRDRDDAEDEYYREKRQRERAGDWDHNHAWKLKW